jgi:serine/threonine protein kinase/tetratricopeptide (TPR) repeat protein
MPSSDDTVNAIPPGDPTGKTAEAPPGSVAGGDSPPPNDAPPDASAPLPRRGDRIGPYVLLDPIGTGAYGEVWKADQKEPVRREVAVKILNAGVHSAAVVARFRAEQQALALMDHPGIAKVFDAGIAPSGLPYFVMQYVKGDTLLAYCDREKLTLHQRLELFASVCEAVHHAHQKGIIHRDLKPSNIMVTTLDTGEPQPVVVDFGIAKAIAQPLTDDTVHSLLGRPQGTWAYMSPEQADGLADIRTTSDVYSLGVILYELLSGVRPFDDDTFRHASEEAKRRLIREAAPPSPGTRLATDRTESGSRTAEARRMNARELAKTLSGELGWIPLYAMRKEPTRRYDSASQFGSDVRNFLAGRALLAAPESSWYRFGKFVRRNRVQVGAAGVTAVALVVGLGTALWQAQEARAQLRRSKAVEQVMRTTLGAIDPRIAAGRDTTLLRSVLDEVIRRADASPEPTVRGVSLMLAGSGLRSIGAVTDATEALRQSVELLTDSLGAESPEAQDAQSELAIALWRLGKLEEAEASQRKLLARLEQDGVQSRDLGRALMNLAATVAERGRRDDAIALLERAEALYTTLGGPDDRDTLRAKYTRGVLISQSQRNEDALIILEEVLERRRRVFGEADYDTVLSHQALGAAYWFLTRFEDAEPHMRASIEQMSKLVSPDDPDLLLFRSNLGALLIGRRAFEEAASVLEPALKTQRRLLGDQHLDTGTTASNLASCFIELKRFDEAATLLELAVNAVEAARGPDDQQLSAMLNSLGKLNADQGRFPEAAAYYNRALEIAETNFGPTHQSTVTVLMNLGAIYEKSGRFAEALAAFARVERSGAFEGNDLYSAVLLRRQGLVLLRLGKPGDAASTLERAHSAIERAEVPPGDQTKNIRDLLVKAYTELAASSPGAGHDRKAAEWKARLDELTAPAQAQPVGEQKK